MKGIVNNKDSRVKKYKNLAIITIVLGVFSLWFIGILLGVVSLVNVKKARRYSEVGNTKKTKKAFRNSIILFVITGVLVALNIFIFYSYIQEIGGWDIFIQEMNQSRP